MNSLDYEGDYEAIIVRLQAERDALRERERELVEALTIMVQYGESPDFDGAPSNAAMAQARAVLAKVRP